MKERLQKLSLIQQIMYLILFMLIILLSSFIVSNKIAERTVENKVTESSNKIILQIEETMTSFFKDMDGISYSLLYSPTIQSYLSKDEDLSRILMNKEMLSVFSSTLALKENMMGIQLYDREGQMAASAGQAYSPVLKRKVSDIEYSVVNPNQLNGTYYTISVPVYNLQNNRVLEDYRGMCVFIMDVMHFKNILSKSKLSQNSKLLLVDQNDQIITGTDEVSTEELVQVEVLRNDNRYIVQDITLAYNSWKIISIIPKKELLEDLNIIKRLNVVTYIIIFSIFCLFLLIFYSRILKPVKALLDFVKNYARSDGQSRFNVVYHNEIGVLANNLNHMLDDIDTLSQDVQNVQLRMYETEIVNKQMEVSTLRNQINPHFLYNTFELIRAMALFHKVEDIAHISTSLSSMFRYSVKGDNIVMIQDEIIHIQEYANIIEFRFRGKIKIVINVDDNIYKVKILKMLLQPIVENAVFHGLEKKIAPGTVHVSIVRIDENMIRVTIADDGCGIEAGRLQELRVSLQQFETSGNQLNDVSQGIGLANSYRRIKLFYGDQADLTIDSEWKSGTTICITIPADMGIKEMGEANV
ncbi:MAG TPA: histidine kinase [Candidatus Paenibacillus intestinavium]|nr:histidine kinase [Candidatus Paenibacillus intestinavium]